MRTNELANEHKNGWERNAKVVSQREALLQEKHIGQPTIFDWPQKN
ncbi:TPA: hypothetical protein LWK27_002844 [Listeria innocua]|nr:hypothetical protein [Listeria monocytogenes]EKK7202422.1 hypothetical protein [Listeria innocua]EED2008600.1 hypothetical protein [Listeria monocytogenes]EGP9219515.1 hypothetical protein [Listeria monocytogenes]HAC0476989.1 hypothetical protein [Listeria monocytogenes]HBM4057170.1 hypothetical protein [Listeria innocua]